MEAQAVRAHAVVEAGCGGGVGAIWRELIWAFFWVCAVLLECYWRIPWGEWGGVLGRLDIRGLDRGCPEARCFGLRPGFGISGLSQPATFRAALARQPLLAG